MTTASATTPPTTAAHRGYPSLRAAWPALAALALALLVEMLDNQVLNVALPTIGRALGATATQLQWVTSAYTLVFAALLLLSGALADRWGRRRVMLAGLALFGLGSLGVLLVRDAAQLIALRAAVGVGAALLAPGTLAMSYRLFADDDLRSKALSLISTVGMLGLVLGPTVGGLALGWVPWQALLLINAPVAALGLAGVLRWIPADRPDELHDAPLDVLGAALSMVAMVGLVGGLGSGVEHGWAAPVTVASLASGALGTAGFVARERRAAHPLLDLRLLADRRVGSACLGLLGLALSMGVGYLLQLHLQLAWGWRPVWAGLAALPQLVVMLAMGPAVAPVARRLGEAGAQLLGGGLLVAALAVMGFLGRFGYGWLALAMVLLAAGLRLVMTISAMALMGAMPENRTSLGASLSDTCQELGSGLGVALVGTVVAAWLGNRLPAEAWPPALVASFFRGEAVGCLVLLLLSGALVALSARGLRRSGASGA